MAKKCILVGLIFLFLFTIITPAYCGINTYERPLKKLGRGFCNLVTFPLEIPLQMSRVNNSDGPMAGITWGILKGMFMSGARLVVGAYEVLTFPVPMPKNYTAILTEPEFFFEEKNW